MNVVKHIKAKWKKPPVPVAFPAEDETVVISSDDDGDDGDDYEPLETLNNACRSNKVCNGIPSNIPDTRGGMFTLWHHVIYGQTEDDFTLA